MTIAFRTVSGVVNGRIQVPDEPPRGAQRSLCAEGLRGRLIGPDLDEDAHYNATTVPMHRLFQEARASVALARKSGDPKQMRQAQAELAFAYGWLSHMAVDLNLHPEVNAVTGDAYKYGGKVRVAEHAEIEGAFDAFLATKGALPPYHPYVPRRLLAKVTGLSEQQIAKNEDTLALKATAGAGPLQGRRPASLGEVRALQGSDNDILAFTRNPSAVKDWDLDCGKISTAEFEQLRKDALRLNGGTLPANFAEHYLAWYQRMKGLTQPRRRDRVFAGLIGGNNPIKPLQVAAAPKPTKASPVKLSQYEGVPKGGAWVIEKTEFMAERCDDSIMQASRPEDPAGEGTGQSSRIVHRDPNTTLNLRFSIAWSVPDRVLIPGKTYTWRFRVRGQRQRPRRQPLPGDLRLPRLQLPLPQRRHLRPEGRDRPGPRLAQERENQARVEIPTGARDATMWVVAHWTCGVRHTTVTYTYRYVMPKGKSGPRLRWHSFASCAFLPRWSRAFQLPRTNPKHMAAAVP